MAVARKKRVYWIVAFLLVSIILVIATAPYILYKNQKAITASAITTLNETLVGHFTIEDSYIAPFANFPYVSIDFKGVKFYDDHRMEKAPIYEIQDLYVGFDFWDIIKGKYNIKAVKAKEARLNLILDENDEMNIAVASSMANPSDEVSLEEDAFTLDLNDIHIQNLAFVKLNESTGQVITIDFDDLRSKLNMSDDIITASLDSRFVLSIVEADSTSFFRNKSFDLKTDFQLDTEIGILRILEGGFSLEDGQFALDGVLDFSDDFELDLRVSGNKPDFDLILAFVPNEIAEVLKGYENQGKIFFQGVIVGPAGGGNNPFIEIEFGCENAYFLNPRENRRLDQIAFKGFYTNGEERSLTTTEFRLTDITARPEEGVFTGDILIRNLADPHISVKLYSDIQLEFLGAFLGIEGMRKIKGQILLSMDFQELVDFTLPENQMVKLKEGIDSELRVKNLSFTFPDYPYALRDVNLYAAMRKGTLVLDSLTVKAGGSDLLLKGSLTDLPAIFHKQEQPVKINLKAASNKLILKELLAFDKNLADSTEEEISDFSTELTFETSVNQLLNGAPLPKGEFFIDDLYAKLKNYPHAFHDFHADILINDTLLRVKDFHGEIDQSDFDFTGLVVNYDKWFQDVKKGTSYFEFNLKSNQLRLNDLLTYQGVNYLPEDYQDEEFRELIVNGDLVLNYDTAFASADLLIHEVEGKMKVHPLMLEDFKGKFHYENEHIMVDRFSGKLGASDFMIDMHLYTGEDPGKKIRENKIHFRSNFLEFDQLSNYDPYKEVNHEDSFNIFIIPFTDLGITLDIKRMNYHKIRIDDFKGNLNMRADHFIHIDTLHMLIAGGQLGMKGYLNGSDPEHIYFKSEMVARNIEIDQLMFKFDNFGQDAMLSDNIVGQISGRVSSHMLVYPDLVPIVEKGEATIGITITNGTLLDFGPMRAMAAFFNDRNLSRVRFDTLENTLTLKDGKLHIPKMTINSSLGFIELSGNQSLDTSMDYLIRVPLNLVTQVGFRSLFGGKNREEIDPDREDAIETRRGDRRIRFLNMRVRGTPENYEFSLGKGS